MIDFSLEEALRRLAQRMQLSEDDREKMRALPFNPRTVDRPRKPSMKHMFSRFSAKYVKKEPSPGLQMGTGD